MPGETSQKIKIYKDSYYCDVELPDKYPLKFYLVLNGDKVYLETKNAIALDTESDIIIDISDTTKVVNQLLEYE